MALNAARDQVQVSWDVSEAIWATITTGAWPNGNTCLLPSVQ